MNLAPKSERLHDGPNLVKKCCGPGNRGSGDECGALEKEEGQEEEGQRRGGSGTLVVVHKLSLFTVTVYVPLSNQFVKFYC